MKKLLPALFLITTLTLVFAVSIIREKEVKVHIVGDILLSRGVEDKLNQYGYDYPYTKIRDTLIDGDITFGNLECPITSGGSPVFKSPKYIFRADASNAYALKNSGFDILNLANNHTMDYGREGLEDTIELLNKENIKTVGAGKDREDARKPVYMSISNTVFGFLSFSSFPAEGYFYLPDRPDVAQVDITKLSEEVKNAKANCDILIVSFHWGREFDNYPGENQKNVAHLSIDSGADIVIGHHPHVLQGVELYKNKTIFYSLGNFIFDKQEPKGTDETIILKLGISNRSIKTIKALPIRIVECQPTIPETPDALRILNNFKKYSENMNSNIYIDEKKGILEVRGDF